MNIFCPCLILCIPFLIGGGAVIYWISFYSVIDNCFIYRCYTKPFQLFANNNYFSTRDFVCILFLSSEWFKIKMLVESYIFLSNNKSQVYNFTKITIENKSLIIIILCFYDIIKDKGKPVYCVWVKKTMKTLGYKRRQTIFYMETNNLNVFWLSAFLSHAFLLDAFLADAILSYIFFVVALCNSHYC